MMPSSVTRMHQWVVDDDGTQGLEQGGKRRIKVGILVRSYSVNIKRHGKRDKSPLSVQPLMISRLQADVVLLLP